MDAEVVQGLLLKAAIFTPIITGLVEAVKRMTPDPFSRYLPGVAIVLGGVFGWLFVAGSALGVVAGLALGLASVGLFEFGKTTVAGR